MNILKALFATSLVLLLVSSGAPASPFALIDHTMATGATTFTTPNVTTVGGNLIIVELSYNSLTTVVLSNSKGNTCTALTPRSISNFTGVIYYCPNPTSATDYNFTVTGIGNIYASIAVRVWSGAAAVPFDSENGATGTGTSIATGTVSPSENGELIVAMLAGNSTDTISVDSGFTISDQIPFVSYDHDALAVARLIQTTKRPVNPTFSWANSSYGIAAIACFKSSGIAKRFTPHPFP